MKYLFASCYCGLLLLVWCDASGNFIDDIQEVTKTCSTDNGVTPEQLGQLRGTVDTIEPFFAATNLQCFGKCFIERSDFVNGSGINVQRLVDVSLLLGKDEQRTRFNLEKCKSLYKRNRDCATSWDLYVCLHKIYQS